MIVSCSPLARVRGYYYRAGLLAGLVATTACSLVSVQPVARPELPDPPPGQIVREIRVEGAGYTREWFIKAAMASQVGQPYTTESARKDYKFLGRLGIFTSVAFHTEPVPDGVVLIASVQEVTPYIPSLSIGLTQENGLEIGPAFSSPNFLGFGGRVSAYARFGGSTNYGARYWDPWVPGKSWLFGYGIDFRHRERRNELDDFDETSDELFFQLRRNLTDELHLGLRFRYLSMLSDQPDKLLSPDGHDNIGALGFVFEVDNRNADYPTAGGYAELEVAKYGLFGSATDFWRLTVDGRRYVPLPFGRRHSMAFYTLLSLTTGEVGRDIPVYMDFHIGGTNSVRGWPLGSRVGKNQWLNTAEYWYRLLDDRAFRVWFIKWRMGLQLGAFADVGTAWSESHEFGDHFIDGYGGGLRLTIPVVVLLRIDFAYARDRFGIQFAIGGGEKALAQKARVR